jgi:hypothetical protein
MVEQHVIEGDGRDADLRRRVDQIVQPQESARRPPQGQRDIAAAREQASELPQAQRAQVTGVVGRQHGDQPFAPIGQVIQCSSHFALPARALPTDSSGHSRA